MFGDLIELVRRPLTALQTIDSRRRASSGLIALALSVTLPAIATEIGAFGPFRPPANLGSLPSLTGQGADIYAHWTYQHRFLLPLYGVVISLLLWFAAAGLIHVIARTLGGQGDFLGYLKLVGYVALVGLVALPVDVIDALLKLQDNARLELSIGQLAGLLGVAIFLWQNLLLVYGARTHYGISTERAVAAVIGPVGGVIILALVLVILSIVLLVVSQGSLGS
ncbi:MAG TPA: Yip1 family protein [Candidatus Dormibacteraeota bacterium]|nr:Yip1 family protein [Candidatus Dormibacteraeota bacterium]